MKPLACCPCGFTLVLNISHFFRSVSRTWKNVIGLLNTYFYTCRFEKAEIVKVLLERGADPLKAGENRLTPLHSAARRGFTEICSLLLKDSRVKTNLVTCRDFSPFHLACLSGQIETCKLFLENGADIMVKSMTQHTLLHFAAWQGHEEICQLLIETGITGIVYFLGVFLDL